MTQQDIQTPSHFVKEEIFETPPATTHLNISPIHLTLTTPHNKNHSPSCQSTLYNNN